MIPVTDSGQRLLGKEWRTKIQIYLDLGKGDKRTPSLKCGINVNVENDPFLLLLHSAFLLLF